MNPPCAKCTKAVYPVEALKCLDQVWHKACFKCETCGMTLNMKNYKGYNKRPYCNAHYPTTKFTAVADTPENLRLKQQSQIQSQIQYHKDFEETKGKYTAVTDDPETLRMKDLKEKISLVHYHKEFEENKGRYTVIVDDAEILRARHLQKFTSSVEYHKDFETAKGTKISTAIDPETERLLKNSQISSQAAYHGVREQRQEQERRRSEIDFDQDGDQQFGQPSLHHHQQQQQHQQQQHQQHQQQQQYRRQPGKISDYDPMANQPPPPKDNTPYSARGQARVVYSNSESTEFGTLIGFQKVQGAAAPRKDEGADPVELRRHGSAEYQPRTPSDRSSASSSKYEPPVADEDRPVFVPYLPEPREETTPQKKPEVMKFRVNTGFEKLKSETKVENQNGKVEGNNNRLSVDDKYTDNFQPPSSHDDFEAPDPYAPPDDVMPSAMPAQSPTRRVRGPTPPPPAEGPPPNNHDSYEVQVQVKYQTQPEYNNHQNDDSGAYPQQQQQTPERAHEPRDRFYSSPAPYDHYNTTQRSYEDYDRHQAYPSSPQTGGQTNPAQMNYSQTLPRGDSRGHYHQDSNRYDPRDPRAADPRYDPRMDPRMDPRYDPRDDPRMNPRIDPRYDPQVDPRHDPRMQEPRYDSRMDPRMDPRIDPRMDPRIDPRMDPRYAQPPQQQQQQSPRGYSTLPNRKGRAAPDPYNADQYQAPRRMPPAGNFMEPITQYPELASPVQPPAPLPHEMRRTVPATRVGASPGGSPRGSPRMTPASSSDSLSNLRKGKGEHGSQASLGSLDSGGSGTMRRQRKPRQPYYRALYDYQAADDDEISFNEGDAIIDVVAIDKGWMEGRVKRTGEYGMLPANYVEFVQ